MNDRPSDREKNRLSARALRYGRVGANVGSVAARIAGRRLFGIQPQRETTAPGPPPAEGLAVRAAPHGGRAWSAVGIQVRKFRARGGGIGFARPGASGA